MNVLDFGADDTGKNDCTRAFQQALDRIGQAGGGFLMPYGGRDDPEGTPFITVSHSAGVKDLNIWYPEQTLPNPSPYPYCLIQNAMEKGFSSNTGAYAGPTLSFQGTGAHLSVEPGAQAALNGVITNGPYLWDESGADVQFLFEREKR